MIKDKFNEFKQLVIAMESQSNKSLLDFYGEEGEQSPNSFSSQSHSSNDSLIEYTERLGYELAEPKED